MDGEMMFMSHLARREEERQRKDGQKAQVSMDGAIHRGKEAGGPEPKPVPQPARPRRDQEQPWYVEPDKKAYY